MKKKVILLLTLLFTLNFFAQPNIAQEKFHIFILMGQSNMAGFATLIEGDSAPQNEMYNLLGQNKSDWGANIEPGTEDIKWVKAKHPIHRVHNSDRFGMAIDFGKQYLKNNPNVKIGFIPCAWGGAIIGSLDKNSAVYKNAMARILYAKKHGVIKGVLWHQGESNTVTSYLANNYEFELHQLIKDLRKDIEIADLPFIAGDLANFYGIDRNPEHIQGIITVRNVLRELPAKIENAGFVESVGLKWQGEGYVHFDRNAYIELGKRYEKSYNTLMNKRNE